MIIPSTSTFSLYISFSLLTISVLSFTPTDHYLINCGSHSSSTVDLFHRSFIGDSSDSNSVPRLTSTRMTQLIDSNPDPDSSPIYHSIRAFTTPSKYDFVIRDTGTHLVRLHFHKFNNFFNLSYAQFHVSANGFLLLHNFNVSEIENPLIIKDFMIWVDSKNLEISFIPSEKSNFAFINAIEVISAPKDLIPDVAKYITNDKNSKISGISKNGYETIHRINVGGSKITPFNDSIWRTWVSDDQYLKSSASRVHFTGRINYQMGGASREVGPDNMYNTARVIKSTNDTIPKSKITWEFPITQGYKYLIRMHFCDIASISLGLIYFNVYVNKNLAYENLDLTQITNGMLASPFYADFIIDESSSSILTVSVGPGNMSLPRAIDGILNGIEIMKMNNTMGSFDGKVCLNRLSKGRGDYVIFWVCAIFVLLIASVIMQRRSNREFMGWSRLANSEVNLKYGNEVGLSKV